MDVRNVLPADTKINPAKRRVQTALQARNPILQRLVVSIAPQGSIIINPGRYVRDVALGNPKMSRVNPPVSHVLSGNAKMKRAKTYVRTV